MHIHTPKMQLWDLFESCVPVSGINHMTMTRMISLRALATLNCYVVVPSSDLWPPHTRHLFIKKWS